MVEVNHGPGARRRSSPSGASPELRGWAVEPDGTLRIGAATTYTDLLAADIAVLAPALAAASRTVGSPQIRNAGTIGGNLGTASPAGDTLPVLVALDAEVELASAGGPPAPARRRLHHRPEAHRARAGRADRRRAHPAGRSPATPGVPEGRDPQRDGDRRRRLALIVEPAPAPRPGRPGLGRSRPAAGPGGRGVGRRPASTGTVRADATILAQFGDAGRRRGPAHRRPPRRPPTTAATPSSVLARAGSAAEPAPHERRGGMTEHYRLRGQRHASTPSTTPGWARACSTCCASGSACPAPRSGCEQGECGSCSVLVDGVLVCACLVLAASAVGTRDHDRRRAAAAGRPA